MSKKAAVLLMVLTLTACAEAPDELEAPATASVEQSVEETPEPEVQEDTTPPEPTQAEILALYDEDYLQVVQSSYPDYPMIVSVDTLDSRIANEFRAAGVTEAVALVPAAYVPYGEDEDLSYYLLTADGALGSCAVLEWLEQQKQSVYDGIDESRATLSYTCVDNVLIGEDEPWAGQVVL